MYRTRLERTHTKLVVVGTSKGRTGIGSDGQWGYQPQKTLKNIKIHKNFGFFITKVKYTVIITKYL